MHYYCVSGIRWVNTLRPGQNGRHFADDIFKCIFLNENVWIPIKISLKFVPKGPINNIPALVQIMAWRRPGDKPLSEPIMVSLTTHICVTRPQRVNINIYPTYYCAHADKAWTSNEQSAFFKFSDPSMQRLSERLAECLEIKLALVSYFPLPVRPHYLVLISALIVPDADHYFKDLDHNLWRISAGNATIHKSTISSTGSNTLFLHESVLPVG